MRRLVDAARQARGDDKTGLAEIARQLGANFSPAPDALREPTIAIIGRISTRMRAAHAEQRRRIVKCGQPWRITGFARRDQADAELAGSAASSARASASLQIRPGRAAPPRRARSGSRSSAAPRAAEMIRPANGTSAARHCRERISRSQSIRSASVSSVVPGGVISTRSPRGQHDSTLRREQRQLIAGARPRECVGREGRGVKWPAQRGVGENGATRLFRPDPPFGARHATARCFRGAYRTTAASARRTARPARGGRTTTGRSA